MKLSLLEHGARWSAAPVAALLFAVSAISPISARAQSQYIPGSSSSGFAATSADEVQAQQSAVEQYWTPERLLSAKPADLHPVVSRGGLPIAPEVPQDNAPLRVAVGRRLRSPCPRRKARS
ncbi:MAG: hypothetical protein ACLQU2_22160 [Candidatus Binataceae bacterium]